MTSGASAANSAACLRMSAALAVAQRVSIRTLRPMVQPNSASACRNAADAGLKFRIVRGCGQEHADAPHPLGLLRARRQRPRRRRAAEQGDELAARSFDHLVGEAEQRQWHVRPSALAVLRLITSLNLSARWTGRSPGFVALEDAVDVGCRLPILVDQVDDGAVVHQAAFSRELRERTIAGSR